MSASRGRGVCIQGGLPGLSLHRGGGLHPGLPTGVWADPPPVNRMKRRCKNITLSQTSFAGGKYSFEISSCLECHYI